MEETLYARQAWRTIKFSRIGNLIRRRMEAETALSCTNVVTASVEVNKVVE